VRSRSAPAPGAASYSVPRDSPGEMRDLPIRLRSGLSRGGPSTPDRSPVEHLAKLHTSVHTDPLETIWNARQPAGSATFPGPCCDALQSWLGRPTFGRIAGRLAPDRAMIGRDPGSLAATASGDNAKRTDAVIRSRLRLPSSDPTDWKLGRQPVTAGGWPTARAAAVLMQRGRDLSFAGRGDGVGKGLKGSNATCA